MHEMTSCPRVSEGGPAGSLRGIFLGPLLALSVALGLCLPAVAMAGSAPIVNAGGPYVISEGQDLLLEGQAYDPDGGAVTASWFLNSDVTGDANGAVVIVAWAVLNGLTPPLSYNSPFNIMLRAVDGEGLAGSSQTTLTIYSRTPIPCFTVSPLYVLPDAPVTADASCSSHPDPRRTLRTYEWFWPNESWPCAMGRIVSIVPPYLLGQGVRTFLLRLRVTDDAGTQAEIEHTFTVVPPIGWCDLQSPSTMVAAPGVPGEHVLGQVRIEGVTGQAGATSWLSAQLGYGPRGSDPSLDPAGWHWTPAAFDRDIGGNEEFRAQFTVAATGEYDYCYRYYYFPDVWVYGDLDGSTNGYSPAQAGKLTVQDPVPTFISSFAAQPAAGGVIVTWRAGEAPGGARFRLQGGMGALVWDVPIAAQPDGSFRAFDDSPAVQAGGVVLYRLQLAAESDGWQTVWETSVHLEQAPSVTALHAAHPNPFNPRTSFAYELSGAGPVELTVFDPRGRAIRNLVRSGQEAAGRHVAIWDGRSDSGAAIPSGVYFARLQTASGVRTVKVTLTK